MVTEVPLFGRSDEIVAHALVDDEDVPGLLWNRWYVHETPTGIYARTNRERPRTLLMHRLIMDAPRDLEVDHVNGNGLDNRRENLRLATRRENARNVRKQDGRTSRFKGVAWQEGKGVWEAYIKGHPQHVHIGVFRTEEDAARAYDYFARLRFGEFAKPNFPNEAPTDPRTLPSPQGKGRYAAFFAKMDRLEAWARSALAAENQPLEA